MGEFLPVMSLILFPIFVQLIFIDPLPIPHHEKLEEIIKNSKKDENYL